MKTILFNLLTLVCLAGFAACDNKYQDDPSRKGLPRPSPTAKPPTEPGQPTPSADQGQTGQTGQPAQSAQP